MEPEQLETSLLPLGKCTVTGLERVEKVKNEREVHM